MTQSNSNPSAHPRTSRQEAYAKQLLRLDIRLRWGKFTEQELIDLKDNDDFVTQLAAKYGLDRQTAQRDADVMLKGRNI
jgi:hypothetical protein